jgi:hypothetical protein
MVVALNSLLKALFNITEQKIEITVSLKKV